MELLTAEEVGKGKEVEKRRKHARKEGKEKERGGKGKETEREES